MTLLTYPVVVLTTHLDDIYLMVLPSYIKSTYKPKMWPSMSNRDFRQIYFYEFKLGRTAAQTARNIIEVWGQGSVNECTVQRWFQKFRAGNTSLEDEPHGSRPPTLG
ncbi:hypothetical protein V3C99_012584 [Haemonchus contortus]|uniref:HTH_48 domain-containing protein n=1 Tax=Haemonchus contortus TaxID=6289 RepID=A0A7I4Y1Z0_HAECO